jgi:eukaryotic-like serine/threonine-protein kinase
MPPSGDAGAGSSDVDAARGEGAAVVTLRQLPQELLGDPQFLRRFRAEAPIVAHLDPTYIVRTRAHIEDAFGLALVSDYIDGAWLRLLLPEATAGHPEAALVVVRDTLLGLETAHREGILHRDLRPDKIMVDRHGIARIADLGVVARTPSSRWMAGTAEYMAPELWSGEQPTIATDLYAAAVVLIECYTGEPPFRGGPVVVRDGHLRAALPIRDLPREIASLVLVGMARWPDQRYGRAWDFAEEVEEAGRILGGAHWERRGRRRLAAAVAAALAPPPSEGGAAPRGLIGRARLRRQARP